MLSTGRDWAVMRYAFQRMGRPRLPQRNGRAPLRTYGDARLSAARPRRHRLARGGGLQSRRRIGQSGAVAASGQDADTVTGADPGGALAESRAYPSTAGYSDRPLPAPSASPASPAPHRDADPA